MKQQTLAMAADQTCEHYRKPTRRDEFLKTMQTIVPWAALCEVIEPHYPKAGNGRPPIGLERMLRNVSEVDPAQKVSLAEAVFAAQGGHEALARSCEEHSYRWKTILDYVVAKITRPLPPWHRADRLTMEG